KIKNCHIMIPCTKSMQKTSLSTDFPVTHELSRSGFSFQVFDSVENLPIDWEKASFKSDVFLNRNYLRAVETAPPKGMRFNYLIFYKDGHPVGRAIFQITRFSAAESVQALHHDPAKHSIWWRIGQFFKKMVARWAQFHLLVCGSSLLTGEYGFDFDESVLSRAEKLALLNEAAEKTCDFYCHHKGMTVRGIFLKDLEGDPVADHEILDDYKYHKFVFHPSMVFHVRPEWKSFEDYLAAISSKYRVRAKRAFKKGKALQKVELNLESLEILNADIYRLYKNVASQASFNMVTLSENYFLELKRLLKDDFRIFAYYLDDEFVGFYTTIDNGDELEAHFLGMDGAANRKTQLYLNMLFDMVRQVIEAGKERLVLARTAMEIKSSVGAVPEDMVGYIRAKQGLINFILPHVLELLRPKETWVPRQPFKETV
ncbi:MAG: GNAT family N-acetyltransferase, partial [Bacteroidetes bacterium]